MKREIRQRYLDMYADAFDSTSATNKQLESLQLMQIYVHSTIAEMLIEFKSPVLPLPFLIDNSAVIALADNERFLDFLNRGIVSTSFFGNMHQETNPIRRFAKTCLAKLSPEVGVKPRYHFSSMPYLSAPPFIENDQTTKLLHETVQIISQEIDTDTNSTFPAYRFKQLSEALSDPEVEVIRRFVTAVKRFEDAIMIVPEDHIGIANYRLNLNLIDESAIIIPMSVVAKQMRKPFAQAESDRMVHDLSTQTAISRERIDMMIKMLQSSEGLQLEQLWDQVLTTMQNAGVTGNERSDYYGIIREWERSIGETLASQLRSLADLAYNNSMATRLAQFKRDDEDAEFDYTIAMRDLLSLMNRTQRPLLGDIYRLEQRADYRELKKQIITARADQGVLIDWYTLSEIVNLAEQLALHQSQAKPGEFMDQAALRLLGPMRAEYQFNKLGFSLDKYTFCNENHQYISKNKEYTALDPKTECREFIIEEGQTI
jgi:hypothetical protein